MVWNRNKVRPDLSKLRQAEKLEVCQVTNTFVGRAGLGVCFLLYFQQQLLALLRLNLLVDVFCYFFWKFQGASEIVVIVFVIWRQQNLNALDCQPRQGFNQHS